MQNNGKAALNGLLGTLRPGLPNARRRLLDGARPLGEVLADSLPASLATELARAFHLPDPESGRDWRPVATDAVEPDGVDEHEIADHGEIPDSTPIAR